MEICGAGLVEAFAVLLALVCAHIVFGASREACGDALQSLVFSIRIRVAQRCGFPVASAVQETPDGLQRTNDEGHACVPGTVRL